MTKPKVVTKEREAHIKEYLTYNPNNGLITWKKSRRGTKAKVGDEAGSINKVSGYRSIVCKGRIIQSHRIAWFLYYGEWPDIIDHKNFLGHDNRICNLRSVPFITNQQHKPVYKTSKSGITGVFWYPPLNKWGARIFHKGESIFLGYYCDKEDAIRARLSKEQELGIRPNF